MTPIPDSRFPIHGFFVTGTDTGVGKTLMACALLHAFAERGYRCIGMKPVASGAETRDGRLSNPDVEELLAASNVAAPRQDVNPYCFAPAIAPHIAATRANERITLERIVESYRRLAALAQIVIVEGVGGFRVPLGEADTAGMARRIGLPVVLVVGMRLGCLNHALLTVESIAAHELRLAGWIANHVDPEMDAAEDNVQALRERIDAPMLARVAYDTSWRAAAVAGALDVATMTR
jgi:dethiobiotin synthetase